MRPPFFVYLAMIRFHLEVLPPHCSSNSKEYWSAWFGRRFREPVKFKFKRPLRYLGVKGRDALYLPEELRELLSEKNERLVVVFAGMWYEIVSKGNYVNSKYVLGDRVSAILSKGCFLGMRVQIGRKQGNPVLVRTRVLWEVFADNLKDCGGFRNMMRMHPDFRKGLKYRNAILNTRHLLRLRNFNFPSQHLRVDSPGFAARKEMPAFFENAMAALANVRSRALGRMFAMVCKEKVMKRGKAVWKVEPYVMLGNSPAILESEVEELRSHGFFVQPLEEWGRDSDWLDKRVWRLAVDNELPIFWRFVKLGGGRVERFAEEMLEEIRTCLAEPAIYPDALLMLCFEEGGLWNEWRFNFSTFDVPRWCVKKPEEVYPWLQLPDVQLVARG